MAIKPYIEFELSGSDIALDPFGRGYKRVAPTKQRRNEDGTLRSGSIIDTSEIDKYRMGVEQLSRIGDKYSTGFVTVDPVVLDETTPSYPQEKFPKIPFNDIEEDVSEKYGFWHEGHLEPFTIRKEVAFTSIESPFLAHSIKAELMGQENVSQEVPLQGELTYSLEAAQKRERRFIDSASIKILKRTKGKAGLTINSSRFTGSLFATASKTKTHIIIERNPNQRTISATAGWDHGISKNKKFSNLHGMDVNKISDRASPGFGGLDIGGGIQWNDLIGTGSSGTNKFTISAWVYPKSLGGNSRGRIVDFGYFDIAFYVRTDQKVYFLAKFDGSSNGRWGTPADSLKFNKWQHLLLTYDWGATGNDPKIYIDGVSQTVVEDQTPDGDAAGIIEDAAAYRSIIGNTGIGNRAWDGYISSVAIWNRILDDKGTSAGALATTGSEVAQVYNEGQPKSYYRSHLKNGLVGWWRMGDGDVEGGVDDQVTIYDQSGNSRNGILSGGWVPLKADGGGAEGDKGEDFGSRVIFSSRTDMLENVDRDSIAFRDRGRHQIRGILNLADSLHINPSGTNIFPDSGVRHYMNFNVQPPSGSAPSPGKAHVTVSDGNAASGMSENEYITIISTDGTSKNYIIVDDALSTVTTGDVVTSGVTDVGSAVATSTGVAVTVDLTGTPVTQNAFLVQLKAAIEHVNGHDGEIVVSSVPTEADGNQQITLTQKRGGSSGNTTITQNISQIIESNFLSGSDYGTSIASGSYGYGSHNLLPLLRGTGRYLAPYVKTDYPPILREDTTFKGKQYLTFIDGPGGVPPISGATQGHTNFSTGPAMDVMPSTGTIPHHIFPVHVRKFDSYIGSDVNMSESINRIEKYTTTTPYQHDLHGAPHSHPPFAEGRAPDIGQPGSGTMGNLDPKTGELSNIVLEYSLTQSDGKFTLVGGAHGIFGALNENHIKQDITEELSSSLITTQGPLGQVPNKSERFDLLTNECLTYDFAGNNTGIGTFEGQEGPQGGKGGERAPYVSGGIKLYYKQRKGPGWHKVVSFNHRIFDQLVDGPYQRISGAAGAKGDASFGRVDGGSMRGAAGLLNEGGWLPHSSQVAKKWQDILSTNDDPLAGVSEGTSMAVSGVYRTGHPSVISGAQQRSWISGAGANYSPAGILNQSFLYAGSRGIKFDFPFVLKKVSIECDILVANSAAFLGYAATASHGGTPQMRAFSGSFGRSGSGADDFGHGAGARDILPALRSGSSHFQYVNWSWQTADKIRLDRTYNAHPSVTEEEQVGVILTGSETKNYTSLHRLVMSTSYSDKAIYHTASAPHATFIIAKTIGNRNVIPKLPPWLLRETQSDLDGDFDLAPYQITNKWGMLSRIIYGTYTSVNPETSNAQSAFGVAGIMPQIIFSASIGLTGSGVAPRESVMYPKFDHYIGENWDGVSSSITNPGPSDGESDRRKGTAATDAYFHAGLTSAEIAAKYLSGSGGIKGFYLTESVRIVKDAPTEFNMTRSLGNEFYATRDHMIYSPEVNFINKGDMIHFLWPDNTITFPLRLESTGVDDFAGLAVERHQHRASVCKVPFAIKNMRVKLMGYIPRAGEPAPHSLNQNLTTHAIHEDIHEIIHDEFDLIYSGAYSGSMVTRFQHPAGDPRAGEATITVADGDAASGMTEGEKITITSTDGTVRVYRLCDDTLTTITTGEELVDGSDTGAGTTADDGDIAVVFNIATSEASQNDFLVQLKAAIEHVNGHNGKIIVEAVPAEADTTQSITLRQSKKGVAGNTTITTNISQVTKNNFSGASDFGAPGFGRGAGPWWERKAARTFRHYKVFDSGERFIDGTLNIARQGLIDYTPGGRVYLARAPERDIARSDVAGSPASGSKAINNSLYLNAYFIDRESFIKYNLRNRVVPEKQNTSELKCPGGFKYGLMSTRSMQTSCVFRNNHYGHVRDMLEQRAYGAFRQVGGAGNSQLPVVMMSSSTKNFGGLWNFAMTSSSPFIEDAVHDVFNVARPELDIPSGGPFKTNIRKLED